MPDILSFLQCLLPQINATTMRQLNQIILAMLALSGRVTMLRIARWTGVGGSYRTMGRFFSTATGNIVLAVFSSTFVAKK
jgi:putative transposase